MTELLYQTDAFLKEFTAHVTAVDGQRVALDRTAFYATGGGQPDDTLTGRVDWQRRYRLMRTHTALHLLCGVIWRDYKAAVTGGNMDTDEGRLDFELHDFSNELAQEIVTKVNEEIAAARPIEVKILPREEAFQIPDLIRTKINLLPEGIQLVRTVNIVGLDLQADGGTHVANTREVGRVALLKTRSKGANNKRIIIALEE
jgi:misacylated tRNA(Ala) deacylase